MKWIVFRLHHVLKSFIPLTPQQSVNDSDVHVCVIKEPHVLRFIPLYLRLMLRDVRETSSCYRGDTERTRLRPEENFYVHSVAKRRNWRLLPRTLSLCPIDNYTRFRIASRGASTIQIRVSRRYRDANLFERAR